MTGFVEGMKIDYIDYFRNYDPLMGEEDVDEDEGDEEDAEDDEDQEDQENVERNKTLNNVDDADNGTSQHQEGIDEVGETVINIAITEEAQ